MRDIEPLSDSDRRVVADQLDRTPRGVVGTAWRCPCGRPGVIATVPRLPNGSPFPTTYYLTCPRAVAACSRLEASGKMAEMTARLSGDEELAAQYRAAHEIYMADRTEFGRRAGLDEVHELDGVSAGGMPVRVKCLHALLGHALAAGPGVNPLGDETAELVGSFWDEPCGADADKRAEDEA